MTRRDESAGVGAWRRDGNRPATAMHGAQRNAQVVIVIVGQRANVLEHAAEVIGGVFPDARPTVPWLPTWVCPIRWNVIGMRG